MDHGGENGLAGGRGPRERRAPRLRAWVALAATVALVAAVLAAYLAYRDLFGRLRQVGVTGLGMRPAKLSDSLNVLVIGSDSRHGRNAGFGARVTGQRSDTVLVLHLSPGLRRAVVLSIPRDSVVPVLACPPVPAAPGQAALPGQAAQPGQVEQINATFAYGGPACLWKTIEHTTGIRLDHFIQVDFTGFEQLINDLGGVTICLPYAINDPHSRLRLSSGPHHVMGAKALAYWRVRYIGTGSDIERILRDQFLLASVAQGIKHADLLADPGRLYRILADVASSLTTDRGFSQSALIALALGLKDTSLRAVRFIEVPVATYPPNPNWVEWAPTARGLFSAISRDRGVPQARPARQAAHRQRPGVARRLATRPSASPQPASPRPTSPRPASPRPTSPRPASPRPTSPRPTSPLAAGGITAGADVCHDSGAFAGPLGGH